MVGPAQLHIYMYTCTWAPAGTNKVLHYVHSMCMHIYIHRVFNQVLHSLGQGDGLAVGVF